MSRRAKKFKKIRKNHKTEIKRKLKAEKENKKNKNLGESQWEQKKWELTRKRRRKN